MNLNFLIKPAYAVVNNPLIGTAPSTNPKAYFNSALQTIFSIFFIVGTLYFIAYVIFAGYHLISSIGDPKDYERAKNELTYSLLGIIVIFSVFAILKFVGTILGIPGLNSLTIPWPTI